MKYIQKHIYAILLTCFFINVFLASIPTFVLPGNIRFFTNKYHSMEPAISEYDLSMVKKLPAYQYSPGDAIAFSSSQNKNEITAHRIIRREPAGFITKGDANEAFDKNLVPFLNVQGKIVGKIPIIGGYISILKQSTGLFFLLVLPGAFIIFYELSIIKRLTSKKTLHKK